MNFNALVVFAAAFVSAIAEVALGKRSRSKDLRIAGKFISRPES